MSQTHPREHPGVWAQPDEARTLIRCLDLTSLSAVDTERSVAQLCSRAIEGGGEGLAVAAVCVWPVFIPLARERLGGSGVRVATVSGGFPSGQSCVKAEEVERAAELGADEIDVTINRGLAIEGRLDAVAEEVERMRQAAGDRVLKVILESAELIEHGGMALLGEVVSAVSDRLRSGDFLKTSTGFARTDTVPPGATPETVDVLLAGVERGLGRGVDLGVKPSGGIRTAADAVVYLRMWEDRFGSGTATAQRLRIGASSLLTDLRGVLRSA